MNTNRKEFGKAVESLIAARNREAMRQVNYRFQHLLIGALTQRP